MPRRKSCKHISMMPGVMFYKPAGIPVRSLEVITLELDEFEAIRLADMEGYYHDEAAKKMNTSRQTFGRIIQTARMKIATAIIGGKALKITETGNVVLNNNQKHEKNSHTHKRDEC